MFQCEVVSIDDGNTFTCLTTQSKKIKINLYETNTPELNQPYGKVAKKALSNIILNKKLVINRLHTYNGRSLAIVDLERYQQSTLDAPLDLESYSRGDWEYSIPTSVNYLMIKDGHAWFTLFGRCGYGMEYRPEYIAEKEAKEAKRGLWSNPNPIPPWKWRTKQK